MLLSHNVRESTNNYFYANFAHLCEQLYLLDPAPPPAPEPVYTDRKCRIEQIELLAEVSKICIEIVILTLPDIMREQHVFFALVDSKCNRYHISC
jgi:hypothetical protein